jgi:ATP-dependent protease ClpP protease subunit
MSNNKSKNKKNKNDNSDIELEDEDEVSSGDVEVKNGDIYFNSDVDVDSAKDFVIVLRELEKKKKKLVDKKLNIYLNTGGGDVFSGFRIYDSINKSSLEITVIVDGLSCSMGTIIMCGAKEVHMTENSYIMIHELSSWDYGRYHQQKLKEKLHDDMMEKFIRIYSEKTGNDKISLEYLEKDRWFNSDQSKRMKLVDKVI